MPDDLHAIALAAARAGSEAIRAVAREDLDTKDKGGADDFLTAADLAAEKAILTFIRRHRPHDRIVAEESGQHAGSSTVCWYVDPLDGTSNFVAGTPDYAVSIAAYDSGTPTAAVIYRPADDLWLVTSADGGLQGTIEPRVAPPKPLGEMVITVSRPHDPHRRDVAMDLRSRLLDHVGAERRTGSAAWSLLLVVSGTHDAYLSVDIPLWDTAAGHLLVERAGGTVTTIELGSGTPVSIAGTPTATAALVSLIRAWE